MKNRSPIVTILKRAPLALLAAVLIFPPWGEARAGERLPPPVIETALNAFWIGDFAELERQNAEFRKAGHLEPDATQHLELFRRGLTRVFKADMVNVEAYLQEVDRLTLQWANDYPKSALAHILHAKALVTHGWSYRGGAFARDVPPDAWEHFHSYLRRAGEYLNAHADVAFTDSYAHDVLLDVGKGLGWKPEQLIAIADAGLKRNPDDVELMFAVVESLLPKWHGDARVLDSYINHAVQQSRAQYGTGMYARLYSAAADQQYHHALFEDSLADWPRMKQSYEDLFARYPDSPYRLNRYAYMACIAKDRQTLASLLQKIGDAIAIPAWGDNPERGLEACRRLAAGK